MFSLYIFSDTSCVNIWICSFVFFFFSSRRRHTRCSRDWSSDVCSSDLFPESFLDNVFGIFPNSCVTKRECKNPSLVTLGETFKTQFISDRKSTRLNSSHGYISYAVFCLKKKKIKYR